MAFAPANFDSPRFLLGDPGVNCFFFFGLIGFHGSVRLEMILLHFASFPLNDTPKPAGAVFLFVGSLNHIFLVLVYLTWLLI